MRIIFLGSRGPREGCGTATGNDPIAEAAEGFFDGKVQEPAAEHCNGDADKEGGINVFANAIGLEEMVREVDQLFAICTFAIMSKEFYFGENLDL